MAAIAAAPLPEGSLLDHYRREGAFTDCYLAILPQRISQAEFILAFYTSWLFKLERSLLAAILSKPSSDEEAEKLARGDAQIFSAWRVENRTDNQLLLCDGFGHTRSWLMSVAGEADATRLYFGSAVIPRAQPSGRKTFGPAFHLFGGFHRLYAHMLLWLAARRLSRALNITRQ